MIDKRRLTNVKVTYEVNTILSDLYNQIEYELRDDYNDSLEQLQSNWNSLREWLEKNIKEKPLLTTYFFECDGKQKSISGIELEELKKVLDKMNELEGKDKE